MQTKGSPDKKEDPVRRITFALVVMCAAALASTAAASTGDYFVGPGQTITFSDMSINSCNTDVASVDVFQPGVGTGTHEIGRNALSECSVVTLDDQSFTNNSTVGQLFRVKLTDVTCGATYDSQGSHAKISPKWAMMNDAGINDSGSDCTRENSPNIPKGKTVNFLAHVAIG